MKNSIVIVSTIVITTYALLVGVGSAYADDQRSEAAWKTLQNEPSRGELFGSWAKSVSDKTGIHKFAFPYSFQFPKNADTDTDGKPRVNSYFGIDISHYNGDKFPLDNLKRQSVAFVYAKATQGTDYADKTFGAHWKGLKALPEEQRIPRGAYHFLSSDRSQSGSAQADSFIAYVNLFGGFEDGDLRPAIDLEWDKACKTCPDRWEKNKRSPDEIITTTLDFVKRVKDKTGWTPIIYTNRSFLRDVHITKQADIDRLTQGKNAWIFDLAASDAKLELANPKDNLPYDLWQFSWGGSLSDGNGGGLDVDSFKGTKEQFDSLFRTRN